MLRNLSFLLLLTGLLGAAYANSFGAGFVLDNETIILNNPALREWNSENLYFIFTKNYWAPSFVSNLYRPVTTVTYAINYCLLGNGTSPFGYHVVNFLLHWINSIAVFFLVRKFTESFIVAGLATVVFAVHPLATEAVTNIVGRADLLMTMFVLMGLHLHLNFRTMHGWLRIGSWIGLFIAAFLSVFSKESGVVLIGLMLAWDLVQARREQASTTLNAVYKHLRTGGWQPYIPVVAAQSVLVFARHAILWRLPDIGQPSVDNPLIMADFWTARMTAIRVLCNYCVLFVWPAKLSCDYSFNQIPLFSWSFVNTSDIVTWLSVVWLAIMLGVLGWAWNRLHSAFYFLAFFFITISPVANLFFISGTIMGERLMYLPSVGLIVFLALVLEAIGKRLFRKYPTHSANARPFMALILGVAVLSLVARTYIRNRDWQSEITLWSSAIKNVPNNVKAYKGLSMAMFRDKNNEWPLDEVIGIAERGVAIVESHNLEPRYLPTSHYMDLGHYYNYKALGFSQAGRNVEAHESSQRAISILNSIVATDKALNEVARQNALRKGTKPDEIPDVGIAGIYQELGHAYLEERQIEKALQMFQYMRHISPLDPFAHFCEGTALSKSGRLEESSISLIKALLLGWTQPRIWDLLVEVHHQLSGDHSAVLSDGKLFTLDVGNPFVRKHLDQAVFELIQELIKSQHQTAAKELRDSAVSKFGCSQTVLDELLK